MRQFAEDIDHEFDTIEAIDEFVKGEQDSFKRKSLAALWHEGFRFTPEGAFANQNCSHEFTYDGFISLCSRLGLRFWVIERLQRRERVHDLLNTVTEFWTADDEFELVIHSASGYILGAVRRGSPIRTNQKFWTDIRDQVKRASHQLGRTGNFSHGYAINTRLILRFTTDVEVHLRKGTDVTTIGFEVSRSWLGSSFVEVSWFILRQVCRNGLTARVAKGRKIIKIKRRSTDPDLKKGDVMAKVMSEMDSVKKFVKTLAKIEFKPRILAEFASDSKVLEIVNLRLFQGRWQELGFAIPDIYAAFAEESDYDKLGELIKVVPRVVGGHEARAVFESAYRDDQSMYDFVNAFTAYANTCPVPIRVDIQRRAGEFATWAYKFRRLFE